MMHGLGRFVAHAIVTVSLVTVQYIATASADSGKRGYYGGVRLIGSVASMDEVGQSGFTNTLVENNTTDLVGGGGVVAGYKWKNIPAHSELEFSYRTRFDFDLRDARLDGAQDLGFEPNVGYQSNVATTSILYNAAYEFRNNSDYTPYIGGSLGWSLNTAETQRSGAVSNENSTHNLAWGLMAGLVWDWNENWGMDFAYRYIDLGTVESGTFATGETVNADSYVSHDVLLTMLYRF